MIVAQPLKGFAISYRIGFSIEPIKKAIATEIVAIPSKIPNTETNVLTAMFITSVLDLQRQQAVHSGESDKVSVRSQPILPCYFRRPPLIVLRLRLGELGIRISPFGPMG